MARERGFPAASLSETNRSYHADQQSPGGKMSKVLDFKMPDSRPDTELHNPQSVKPPLDPHLKALENESIHIFREVAAEFDRPVMLYSVGKDSSVLLHLA